MFFHEEYSPFATEADAVREYTRNVGREHPERAWILSPYDTWEANPYYSGPPARHPEDDTDDHLEPVPAPEGDADPLQDWPF